MKLIIALAVLSFLVLEIIMLFAAIGSALELANEGWREPHEAIGVFIVATFGYFIKFHMYLFTPKNWSNYLENISDVWKDIFD